MTGRISILDTETANRIAAGEVVERPASVIKELCENAIDAGATAITVEIESGGLQRMTVTDNGNGIHPEDMTKAFLRHATGKIRSGDSLAAIETLGFRGEALCSIAAVAKVEMTSRQPGAFVGKCVAIHGGVMQEERECGCPEGTSITVADLFFNTPARLKFMKTPAAEAAQISDTLLRMILSQPQISFRFINNGKTVYHSPGTGLQDAIHAVYGAETAGSLVAVHAEQNGILIDGFVGKPAISRQNRQGQSLFVNGRYVRDAAISQAVQRAYRQTLMVGRFPFYVLNMQLSHASVDVNVHPQKLEVRFSEPLAVQDCFFTAVEDALFPKAAATAPIQSKIPTYELPGKKEESSVRAVSLAQALEKWKSVYPVSSPKRESVEYARDAQGVFASLSANPAPAPAVKKAPVVQEQLQVELKTPIRVLGQIFQTYILAECGETLMVIDQHAAHERLTYDAYAAQIAAGNVAAQQLLTAEVIELTYDEMQKYEHNVDVFHKIGFETEAFGPTSIAVRAVPLLLGKPALKQLLKDVLDTLSPAGALLTEMDESLIRSACRHSVKAGDVLSAEQLESLVRRLQDNEQLTCPHGRPVALKITKHDLEKGFMRIV